MILKEVESGKIELVEVGNELRLQFNCSCMDALPMCRAMCCRMQQQYSAIVTPEDMIRLWMTPRLRLGQDADTGAVAVQNFVPVKEDKKNECLYLDELLCSVHGAKPAMCRKWHCSPGGVGEGLEIRASGWRLVPTQR